MSNDEYPSSLERMKLYASRRDGRASAAGFVRIVDESGEDYLYPARLFREVSLPASVARAATHPRR